MQIVEPPLATSILAIAAHPDDIERWIARARRSRDLALRQFRRRLCD